MTKINSSAFGLIIIDGKTYNHDVYILPSGRVEEREHSHTFTKEQVEHILKENPEVVIIGKGVSGCADLNPEARILLEDKEIEIIEDNTSEIKDKFNEFSEIKRVAAIIHITC